MLAVVLTNQARRFLRKSPSIRSGRITEKMEGLRADPFPPDAKRVVGYPGKAFRVRVGAYRIVYCVVHELNELHIIQIDDHDKAFDF